MFLHPGGGCSHISARASVAKVGVVFAAAPGSAAVPLAAAAASAAAAAAPASASAAAAPELLPLLLPLPLKLADCCCGWLSLAYPKQILSKSSHVPRMCLACP